MKIRTDYVTNSSSSSFIISKKDNSVTKDTIFLIIKNFYLEFLEKRDKVIEYIEKNPDLNLTYKKEETYCHFQGKEGKWDKETINTSKILEEKFGISLWDNFEVNYDWLKCNSYEEYEKYWLNIFTKNKKVHAPFTIGSFEEDKIIWLHWGCGKQEEHDVGITSELISWYYEFLDEECTGDCQNCTFVEKKYVDECIRQNEIIKSLNTDNLCLALLGDFCVYSESGYIPDYVVKKLSNESKHSCNHMG